MTPLRTHRRRAALAVLLLTACPGRGDTRRTPDDSGDSGAADSGDTGSPPAAYNGCTSPDGPRASGTWAEPVLAEPPFTDRADTTASAEDVADVYDCSSAAEGGREIVYRLPIALASHLRVEVLEDPDVDVDIHLLRDPVVGASTTGCIARANTVLEVDVEPGDYLLAIDTYGTDPLGGGYLLAVEAWPEDAWVEVPLGDGLTWRHLRSVEGTYGNQTFDVLEVDLDAWDAAPWRHEGCETVGTVAARTGARAAINAGFFDDCAPLDFVRRDGVTYAEATASWPRQRLVAWDDGGGATTDWVDNDADWTERANAVGSYPSLVAGGAVALDPAGTSTFFTSKHPRTALGITAAGHILLVTADGRSSNGDGLTIAQLAALMVELGAADAVNLDGGGSTTMYVKGCSVTGVVNHPSDGGGEDHFGSRAVSDGVYLSREAP